MQMKISGKQNFPETIFKNLYSQYGKLYKVEISINFKTEFLSEITMYSKTIYFVLAVLLCIYLYFTFRRQGSSGFPIRKIKFTDLKENNTHTMFIGT